MKQSGVTIRLLLLVSAAFLPQGGAAQEAEEEKSAAVIFERTLAEHGTETAVAEFRGMMADTSGTYTFDGRELMFAARKLVWDEKRMEAIELFKLISGVYPESHWPWLEMGRLYIVTDNKTEAERSLRRTLELNPDDLYVEWILRNLDELLEVAKIQVANQNRYTPGKNTGIQGPYLGEEPPGPKPRVFAPGILNSAANEFSISFSPDGREIYFSRTGVGVMVCRWEKAGWTAPELVRFFADSLVCDEANVAPDGKRIFFNARPTLMDEREVYQAERVGDRWGVPKKLFPGMYATSTLDGTLYYTADAERPDYGAIVKRRLTEDGYAEPELLGGGINSEFPDAHPFIAPDESFILFDSPRDPQWSLYICFREADGSWGKAIRLNDHLDIPAVAGQCILSPDGRYLFFSLHNDMYWVSAENLKDLKAK